MTGKSPPNPTFDPKEEKQMTEHLTQHLHLLQETAMLQVSVREEKKLLVENSKLKKDIDDLKKKLQETQRKKSMKLHQERILTASVAAMKAAILELPASSEPTPASRSQRSNTQKQSEGRRRQDHRGVREEVARVSKGTHETVYGLERDPKLDVSRLDLRIGRVLAIQKHPDSESLYVQEMDVGDSAPRTVVSELTNYVPPEQLQDTLMILLCNIRPVKVRGVQSRARILCAINQQRMEPLTPPAGAQPGDRVTFRNYPSEAERELNPKQRVWERLLPNLRTDERGVATYRGVAFEVRGKGFCRAPTINNGGIK